jgi:hypothetical protein
MRPGIYPDAATSPHNCPQFIIAGINQTITDFYLDIPFVEPEVSQHSAGAQREIVVYYGVINIVGNGVLCSITYS